MKVMDQNDEKVHLQGPLKLAIFDIDKTFVCGDSFKWFCWFALRRKGVRLRRLFGLALDTFMYLVGRLDVAAFKISLTKALLGSEEKAKLTAMTQEFLQCVLLKRVHTVAVDRLRWHKQENHLIVVLSASPDLYLNQLGTRFGADSVICTKFLDENEHFEGKIYGINCKGEEKRRRLLEEYAGCDVDWDQSYGYGNSAEDVPFLELLGNVVAINPDRQLRKIAAERNWVSETWSC